MTEQGAHDEELFARILESPDDAAPRRAYSDWLVERGDPRGELIKLQCKPPVRAPSRDDAETILRDERAPTERRVGAALLLQHMGYRIRVEPTAELEQLLVQIDDEGADDRAIDRVTARR